MDSRLFEEIYNENVLQKAGQALVNAGNNMTAASNVKSRQKDEKKAAAIKAAQSNTSAAQEALKTLQAIANEQQQFDPSIIKSLMDSINKLQIGDDVKKSINHILNSQNAALQKQSQNNEQQNAENTGNADVAAGNEQQADNANGHMVNVNGKTMSAIDAVTKDNNDFRKAIPFFKQIGVTADEVKQGVDALWNMS